MAEHGFDLGTRLARRERKDLRRTIDPVRRVDARTAVAEDPGREPPSYGDEPALVFASNNYLGLTTHPDVQWAAAEAARTVGTGAGASRLLTGDTCVHRELERSLADRKEAERALVFSSGYAANAGTIAALDPAVVFSDELNHASIVDGCRLADAETVVYDHCDPADLAAEMERRADADGPPDPGLADGLPDGSPDAGPADGPPDAGPPSGPSDRSDESSAPWLIVTDSLFSMDGDVAPLSAICDVADRYGAWVMVDEAHATGLYGNGGGIVQREGLADRVEVQMGTLSKALASQGGYVAGDEQVIEYLVNAARSFVFSTGLAPPAAAAAREALRIAREGNRRRDLWENVDTLRGGLESLGYEVAGESQILPVMIRDRRDALALGRALEARGVLAPAIRPPTVPEGTARLRVTPMATHDATDIDRCLDAFAAAGEEVGVL